MSEKIVRNILPIHLTRPPTTPAKIPIDLDYFVTGM